MKKLNLKKIYNIIKRYVSIFLCMFAVYIGCYSVITLLIFNHYYFPLNYVVYMFIISCIVALILMIILNLNHLNFIVQTLLIYATITASIYFVGFFTNVFTRDISFWTFSLIINLVGLCILLGIVIIKRTLENKELNEQLKDYKEGDKE